MYFSRQFIAEAETASKRAAEAVLEAPKNTRVVVASDPNTAIGVDLLTPNPLKVEATVPQAMGVRVENGIDQGNGTRAPFQLILGN